MPSTRFQCKVDASGPVSFILDGRTYRPYYHGERHASMHLVAARRSSERLSSAVSSFQA